MYQNVWGYICVSYKGPSVAVGDWEALFVKLRFQVQFINVLVRSKVMAPTT